MGPHRRNSHDDTPAHGGAVGHDLAGLKFDRLNGPWPCAAPKGCLYNNGSNAEHIMITQEDLRCGETVRVICSNENCGRSPYMHAACFLAFEESAMAYLKSQGRARGWSEKQRLQNLWTKRGYDLVYKACDCPCGHGHLRKDLDWISVGGAVGGGADAAGAAAVDGGGKRKRKKSKSGNGKPTLTIGLPAFGSSGAQCGIRRSDAQTVPRNRTNSLSSNTSGSSSGSSPCELSSASPSSNDGIQPPRRALLQDRSRDTAKRLKSEAIAC